MTDFTHSLAILIGIDAYGSGIPRLTTAINDATRLAELLHTEHSYETLLLTEQAIGQPVTQERLRILFTQELPTRLGEDDRLLVYFAGHGVALEDKNGPAGYLVPQDARLGDSASMLAMTDLHAWLTALPCRHMLAILDCCFAGAFRWSATRDLGARLEVLHKERYDRYLRSPAWQVLTSAAYDQTALDVLAGDAKRGARASDLGLHSPFALALFGALAGAGDLVPKGHGDGVITATELFVYLQNEVSRQAEEQADHEQMPGLWPLNKHRKGEFIFLAPGHPLNLPPAPDLTEEANPYRGLKSYDQKHAPLFFGREEEIRELVGRVEAQPFMAVLGASGTGKSSLLKAGLLSRLAGDRGQASGVRGQMSGGRGQESGVTEQAGDAPYRVLPPMRPTDQPVRALETLLRAELGEDAAGLAGGDDELAHVITRWSEAHPDQRLVLTVDQFEELATLCRDDAERARFLRLLATAVQQQPTAFRLIITLRTDFEPQFTQAESPLAAMWPAARYVAPPMDIEDLRQVIEGPASVRVLYFDPPELVDDLIKEVIQTPGALPLLSFTLSEVYVKYVQSGRDDRALSGVDYKVLGGVVGSLRNRATEEYDHLPDDAHRTTMQRVMLRMVAIEGGELARRRVMLGEQGELGELEYPTPEENERVKTVLHQLVEARLLVSDIADHPDGTKGDAYVEPAHDALVLAWDKLLRWKKEAEEYLPLQRRLAQVASEWRKAGLEAKSGLLWDDDPRLPQVEETLWPTGGKQKGLAGRMRWAWQVLAPKIDAPSDTKWLNGTELAFVQTSVRARTAFWRRTVAITLAVMVALAGLTTFALIQRSAANTNAVRAEANAEEANRQRATAIANEQIAKERQAEAERRLSLQLLAQSNIAHRDQQPLRSMLLALEAAKAFSPILPAVQTALYNALMAPNGYGISSVIHGNTPGLIRFSPDSGWLVIADTKSVSSDPLLQRMNPTPVASSYAVQLRDLRHLDAAPVVYKDIDKPIVALSFSGDGTVLLIASGPQLLQWDLSKPETGPVSKFEFKGDIERLVSSLHDEYLVVSTAHETYVWAAKSIPIVLKGYFLCMSADGKQIVTTDDARVFLWDLDEPANPLRIFPGGSYGETAVAYADFSSDGRWLVSWNSYPSAREDGARVTLWNTNDPESQPMVLYRGIRGPLTIDGKVLFTADSRRLILGGFDLKGQIRVFDLATAETEPRTLITSLNNDLVFDLDISVDGQLLAATTPRGVDLFDLLNPASDPVHQVGEGGSGFSSSTFARDSHLLASTTGRAITIWDLESQVDGSAPARYEGCEHECGYPQLSNDGQWLAIIDYSEAVRLWRTKKPSAQPEIAHESNSWAWTVALSNNNRFLATGYDDGHIRLWDLSTVNASPIVYEGHRESVYRLEFSPDDTLLASASADRTAHIWKVDPANGELKSNLTLEGHRGRFRDVAFSHNGRWLATACEDKQVRLWKVDQLGGIETAPNLTIPLDSAVNTVDFSADDETLFIGTDDGEVYHWGFTEALNVPKKVLVTEYSPIWDVEAASIGSWLAVSVAGSMILLDPRTENHRPLPDFWGRARSVEFSKDGRWLSGGNEVYSDGKQDNLLWIADLAAKDLDPVAIRHPSEVTDQVFSSDGNHIVTVDSAGTTRMWSFSPEALVLEACRVVGRNLTQEEWDTYFPGERYRSTCQDIPAHWSVAWSKQDEKRP